MIKMIKLLSGLFVVVSIKAFQFAARIGSERARCLSVTVVRLTEQLAKLGSLGHRQSDVHHTFVLTSKVILISDSLMPQTRTGADFLRKVLLGYIRNLDAVAI